ncbi:uncharacterized protein LOC135937787 [Cloeon dipterum]|uniref:uncharacterized protein LOC135937787 n=1 Tax=Cloeon dipterum TaxID=197152 RepID=UPI00321FC416
MKRKSCPSERSSGDSTFAPQLKKRQLIVKTKRGRKKLRHRRVKSNNQLLQCLPEEVVKRSMSVFVKQPLYRQSDFKQSEVNYMISLALTPLQDSETAIDLTVIKRHLSGLQPQLKTHHLAKGLLFHFIRKKCKASLEKPLVALVRLLSVSDLWMELDAAVVSAVPDCVTVRDGPEVGPFEAQRLGNLGAWLCVLGQAPGRLLAMLSEMVGRGGSRALSLCIGALEVWPAVLSEGLLAECVRFSILALAEERPIMEAKQIWDIFKHYGWKECPSLDTILQKIEASMIEGKSISSFSAILLSRVFGPRWTQDNLVVKILSNIVCSDGPGVPLAIVTLGQIGRYLNMSCRRGRLAARKLILIAIFDALNMPDVEENVAEMAVVALVAFFGPGRPFPLSRALQRIPAAYVSVPIKERLVAWCQNFIQPKFLFRKRPRNAKALTEPEDNMICNLKFPETLKELFDEDLRDISDSECRFVS